MAEWNKERVANMAKRVAQEENDEPLRIVDEALDALVASLTALQETLPQVRAENVPEQAAIDSARELLDEALLPYAADLLKTMSVFGE